MYMRIACYYGSMVLLTGCGKFFYVLKTFMMHLKTRHPTSHPKYSCHVCITTYATVELLISVSILCSYLFTIPKESEDVIELLI